MSGLFGVIDSTGNCRVDTLLRSMGRAMTYSKRQSFELFMEESGGLGLGRIGIGIFNAEKQPAVSQDGNLVCFFCGDLFNSAVIRKGMEREAGLVDTLPESVLLLNLYSKKGKAFLRETEGKFILSIWDKTEKTLLVANCFLGLYPLFYAHYRGRLVYSSGMKGILCDPEFMKDIDLTALAEYMRFQTVLGERSFFRGIKFLPGASILHYSQKRDELRIDPYWDFSEIREVRAPFEDVVEETGLLLRRAVNRIYSKSQRPGVFLSGGLDSRTLVSLIDRKYHPLVTVTYGRKNSRDAIYAQMISRKLRSRHYFFDLENGAWVKEYADSHLEATEGYQSWIHGRASGILNRVRQILDVGVFGYGQAALLAQNVLFSGQDAKDEPDIFAKAYDFLSRKHTWPSIDEAEEARLYAERFHKQIRGLALASLRSEIERFKHLPYGLRLEIFRLKNNQIKLFHFIFLYYGTQIEVCLPYFDNSVAQYGLGLPLWMKKDKKILRALINRYAPKLSRIPIQKDGLIISDRWFYKYPQRFGRRIQERFNRHIFPFFPQLGQLEIDFEGYLCRDLKDWGESILFDRRTLARGIFNPQFLRSVWARLQSGKEIDIIGKIAPIMTYEMMLRRFYD